MMIIQHKTSWRKQPSLKSSTIQSVELYISNKSQRFFEMYDSYTTVEKAINIVKYLQSKENISFTSKYEEDLYGYYNFNTNDIEFVIRVWYYDQL